MRTALWLAGTALLVAACAGNSKDSTDTGREGDGPESAVIRTTTTAVPAPETTLPASSLGPVGTEPQATSTAGTETATTPVPTTTIVVTTTTVPAPPPPIVGDPRVATELVGRFQEPVDLAVRSGDPALWIVEKRGQVVRSIDGAVTTALSIGDRLAGGGEQGVLGLAFSPDGARAYVNYTQRDGATVITEFDVVDDGTFDLDTERTVMTVPQPFENHNAGDLEFGPDGMLYIPLGDGGSGGDPRRHGSNPETLLGSLLRIDPSPSGDSPYTVPADNPFADGTGGAPEVWSWGLRNPWKIAFDPITDELWIADVGQNQFEEINVVGPADGFTAGRGLDFGWSAFEGDARFNGDVPDTGATTPPVLTYDHGDGCSISGGAPYRGSAIEGLEPAYVYSDFCTSTIWALDLVGGRNLTLVEGLSAVTAVREGPDGELYVLQAPGEVLRLVAG